IRLPNRGADLVSAGAIEAGRLALLVRVHRAHHQQRNRRRAADQPALDHPRRRRTHDRSQGARCRRTSAAAAAGRALRIHERQPARHAQRRDARQLLLRRRGRRTLRRGDPAVRAQHAAHAALNCEFPRTRPRARAARRCLVPAACVAFSLLANGCAMPPSSTARAPSEDTDLARSPRAVASLPGWADDELHGLHAALERQCELPRPPHPWPALCAQLPAPDGLARWIEARFDAWAVVGTGSRRDGLLTGYYEPILHGTRTRVSKRQVALHARPADLVALADGSRARLRDGRPQGPYPTRAQIEHEGLPQAEVLLWL